MVLVLHALLQTGALEIATGVYYYYWTLEALCICAVNIFVLISGYFQVESKFKSKNVIKVGIGGVWLYSIVFFAIQVLVSGQPVGKMDLIRACFPLLTKRFWFVNSYLALYILSPYINKLIHSLSKKQISTLTATLVLIFSARSTILPASWGQDLSAGMGILWFITLYCVAAWLRSCRTQQETPFKYWILYLGATVILIASKFVLNKAGIESYSGKLFGYSSLVVCVQAVALFKAFLHSKPIGGKLVTPILFAAKHSFSVYIIHFAMMGVLFTNILHLDNWLHNPLVETCMIIGATIAIFAFCVCVDFIKNLCTGFAAGKMGKTGIAKKYNVFMDKWSAVANETHENKGVHL